MLPKSHRIPSSEIRALQRKGRRISNPEMQLVYQIDSRNPVLQGEDSGNRCGNRFAVVVSIKVDKRATARNRIKRLIHESLHHLLPVITLPIDGIFQVKKNIHDMSQASVESFIRALLQKAGVIHSS